MPRSWRPSWRPVGRQLLPGCWPFGRQLDISATKRMMVSGCALKSWRPRGRQLFLPKSSGSQFHHPPGRRGLVDGQDDFDGAATFAAIDQGGPAGFNGLYKVGQLPGMADVGNRRRIARSTRSPSLLSEALPDMAVLFGFRRQFPADQIILFDDGRALVAVDGDGLGQS